MTSALHDVRRRALATALFALGVSASCSGATPSDLLSTDAASAVEAGPHDAATDEAAMDTGPVDTGPPSAPIYCAGLQCKAGAETCCRTGSSGEFTFACTAVPSCSAGLSIPCTDADDCTAAGSPGTVCCGTFRRTDTVVVQVSCLPKADCVFGDDRVILCGGQPDDCPTGMSCQTSVETLPGFQLCIDLPD